MILPRLLSPARRPSRSRGFTLVELVIALACVGIAAMAGVAYVTRATQSADHTHDRIFARQKALSILQELRGFVEGGGGEVAADLDGFDDGLSQNATLSIAPDPTDPGAFVAPDHKVSGNVLDMGEWRWYRRITVRRFPGVVTRDLRVCTVRMYRHRPTQALPGDTMAEVSSVIRTVGDAYPTTQVYDVYLLALENVPGWWVYMDSIKPFIDATLSDLEARNPGLSFRTHWITTSAYGRDDQYAPYTNETRVSTDTTPWAYVYPGTMPTGSAAPRYYVPANIRARMNLDGVSTPTFVNDRSLGESFTDTNGNGKRDAGEAFTDSNSNGVWDAGNPVPYALCDQQNHAKRWPTEDAMFQARVAAGVDTDDTPTWRLLLDRMIADPTKYHNAIFINLHGELLPMPAVRNYGDPSKDPTSNPGWRVVAHPELLRPRRTAGSDTLSDAARWRVYGYKTEFQNTAQLMTQREPFTDTNKNGVWDAGEPYQDWNGDGRWTDETPITIEIPSIDATAAVNAATSPSMLIKRLPGGIDADGNGTADTYVAFANAPTYPEKFTDTNGDGRLNVVEPYFDVNGNGVYDVGEPYKEIDGAPGRSAVAETYVDANGDGKPELTSGPADVFTDTNGNGKWDAGEPFYDINGDGVRNGPTAAILPWRAWNAAVDNVSAATRTNYAKAYGEPYTDVNANGAYDAPEPLLIDNNANGVWDGGYKRGEMWYQASYDATANATVVVLHATPLMTPATADGRGLATTERLYDLDYIPCPMINSALSTAPPFERDLAVTTASVPKNTARWTVEVPLATLRKAFETTVGANNGDAKDHILELRTRIGTDRTTGTMWPTKNRPENLSRAWSYWYGAATDVPFSERYQFQGDPRHCPYADLDRYGQSYPNGYNWYFDNFNSSGTNAQSKWLAFDATRLANGWMGRSSNDTARAFSWIRSAITKTEAVYTTLTGFSYFYVSLGGDVGYDSANGFASSIPMDGAPFGSASDVFEDTIAGGGTAGIGGSQKFVRSNNGNTTAGVRSGGYWWSKPWIGELAEDATYAAQWATWGNLRAATGTTAQNYHLLRRGDVATVQLPTGTTLANRIARTAEEGSTSFFNVGTSTLTYHHQYADGQTGTLTGDGPQLAANYNFPLPTSAAISRPFNLASNASGGVGPEFPFTTEYPRYTVQSVVDFYNHQTGNKGSGLVRLIEPGASPKAGFIVVNGIDRTSGSGSAFIARYSLLSLVHSFFAAGASGTGRIKQLPRLQITSPTIVTELSNPTTIPVMWKTEWKRWDGLPYTSSYAATFTETESDLRYLLMYSKDNGRTWLNMKNDVAETPGTLPWITGVGVDPARTVTDAATGNETFNWSTPAAKFPEGSYLIRIEGYRNSEAQHYVIHQEKIYVNR